MRVAVTGGTGFIGRHVVPILVEHGHRVSLLARNLPRNPDIHVSVLTGRITDAIAVDNLVRGADAVIHLAGIAHTEITSEEDRRRARQVNVEGTSNVLQSALRSGVRRVVIASSVHVYEHQVGIGIDETWPQGAGSFYAETKIEIERLALQHAQRGLEVVIGRPTLTYGPGVRFNLLRLLRAIDRGSYFHVGGRQVVRSFGSVFTAAEAFVFLAEHGQPGEAYNIADRKPITLNDFTNDLADRLKRTRPRSLPYPALLTAAAGGSVMKRLGLPAPISLASLAKISQSFSVSTAKLASAGFGWRDTGSKASQAMVEDYRAVYSG